MIAWLRREIERDLSAARIIGAGGFEPQRWDTQPPGQVNPEHIPASDEVSVALGLDPAKPQNVTRAALLRTARLLMRGEVMVPSSVWAGASSTL